MRHSFVVSVRFAVPQMIFLPTSLSSLMESPFWLVRHYQAQRSRTSIKDCEASISSLSSLFVSKVVISKPWTG
jgi:hypothetical protein